MVLSMSAFAAGPGSGTNAAPTVYSCPPAPSGWLSWPGNPSVLSPTPGPGEDSAEGGYEPGITQVHVVCDYSSNPPAAYNHVTASAVFALPIDANPVNDFYFGCKRYAQWTPSDRVFLAMSPDRYATAAFSATSDVSADDVANFEKLTQQLLGSVADAAHRCSVDTKDPLDVPASWAVQGLGLTISGHAFKAAGEMPTTGGVNGVFVTHGGPNAANDFTIASVQLPDLPLRVTEDGTTRTVMLHVVRGVRRYYKAPHSTLVVAVTVTSTNEPSCPKGSTGTLTLSTSLEYGEAGKTSGRLDLCKSLFVAGKRQTFTGQVLRAT